ncbi:MAG: putative oxidoreductase [Chloroflexi bacterium]|jgi:aryl-alcohol dehydrogenase-like predicted oxidoreductase|nr:putative oxidoreductase [Chloroflexota bacterium]
METRTLGRTGLKVSPLCLGTMQFGWSADESASFAVMDAYVEAGGNFLDTADVYSRWVEGNPGGVSEQIIGRWMKARGNRQSIVLATKVRGQMGPGPNDQGLSRRHIMDAVEASLRRLQTDFIDLYQSHSDDQETPLDETMSAFDDLRRQGKVRYVGASNYSAWRLTRALWESDKHGYARYDSLQPNYSLAHRDEFERELEPLCLDQGIAVIPYSPLARGFLSGKYRVGQPLPDSARAERNASEFMNERGMKLLAALDAAASDHNATVAQVALAWLLARPSITSPILGANNPEQLRELIPAADLKLSQESIAAIDEASAWT